MNGYDFRKLCFLMIFYISLSLIVSEIQAREVNNWISQGNKYLNEKSYEEALSCFNRAIKEDANNSAAWHQQGAALYEMGQPKEALDSFRRVLEIDPDFISTYRYQASVLQKLRRFQEANVSLQRADKIAGQWQTEALNLWSSGNYQRALVYCDLLLSHNTSEGWAWNMKGLCLCNASSYNAALSCFDQSLEKGFANDYGVLFNKAECLLALQQHKEAIHWYEKALQIKPDYVSALQSKADALEAIGQHKEADLVRKQIHSIQRKARFRRFADKVSLCSGQIAIVAMVFAVCCLWIGLFSGPSWVVKAGVVGLLLSCTGGLVWLSARWNWYPLILVLGVVGFLTLIWRGVGTRYPGDWPLWWQHRSVRQTLLWKHSTGPAKKDAALRLSGSTVRSDIKALVRALRDPEVSTTAASVLNAIANNADKDLLKTLRDALASEKNDDVKKVLEPIIEKCQIKVMEI